MEWLLSLGLGFALAAACGFRVFVPVFFMSLAANSGHLHLASGFEWLATPAAAATLGVATVVEVLGFYFPFVDNALDAAATPAAVVAGTVVTAAAIGDMSPLLQWSLAAVAGGGTAGAVQVGTVKLRLASSALTAGTGNPVVSTVENGGAVAVAGTAVLFPMLGAVVALMVAGFLAWRLWRRPQDRSPALASV